MIFIYKRNNMMKFAISRLTKCYLMFFMIFINDFNLFRNVYRFLINIYAILISMTLTKRNRKANIFFIILELHKLELSNVINAINFSLA